MLRVRGLKSVEALLHILMLEMQLRSEVGTRGFGKALDFVTKKFNPPFSFE
jgi:hypothetical protein